MGTAGSSPSGGWGDVALALVGAAWAAFLLPPQRTVWDGPSAPEWAQRLSDAGPYQGIRRLAAAQGMTDDYALFGSLVAWSFLLIGLALWRAMGPTGRWTRAMAVLTMVGAPIVLLSYTGHDAQPPWSYFWGTEALVLLAIGLCAIPASIVAYRRGRLTGWRFGLLISTLLVLGAGTAVFGYWPHGSMVAYGVEVALLAAPRRPTS